MSKKQAVPTDAFWSPEDLDEANELIVRRSDLEQWLVCPAMGRLASREEWHGNALTQVGEAVHQCLGRALQFYISDMTVDGMALRHELKLMLMDTRPDIQPAVLKAAKRMIYEWASYIVSIPRGAIMAFDGGEAVKAHNNESETRSGQLSWRIDHLNVVVTSELDLLHATRSPDVICEVDYKSGWKRWDYEEVSTAFQFNLHAWLLMNNYPDVQHFDIRIWNARTNSLAPRLRFSRHEYDDIDARVMHAASIYRQWHDKTDVPAWPDEDKCRICPVAGDCPRAALATRQSGIDEDPQDTLKTLVALQATVEATKKRLWDHVTRSGKDVVCDDGTAFGYEKPTARRKNPNPLYRAKKQKDSEDA